jgi:hypothetical protein
MDFPCEQIESLKAMFGDGIKKVMVAGRPYIFLPNIGLPQGCSPDSVDALLCPFERDGYSSRLYISAKVSTPGQKNWNGNIIVDDRNWYAISWKIPPGIPLHQMIAMHLKGFS